MLKILIEAFKKSKGRMPNPIEMLQLKFKAAQQSGKGKVIEFPKDRITDWTKPRPTTGPKGEVIDTSFKSGVDTSGKRVTMSNDDYADFKDKWFSKIIANTDEALNTFLKRGIDASDERFLNLTPNQRKDFLNMVEYRLKHGNKKFMNDFTDAKGNFKYPEDLAYGGLAGMLGERTPYKYGKTYKKRKKKDTRPYKSLEDIPPDVLAQLKKDPNFDLETFLNDFIWSDPKETRFQAELRGEGDDVPWGALDTEGKMHLFYQKFGKSEPIAGGFLGS